MMTLRLSNDWPMILFVLLGAAYGTLQIVLVLDFSLESEEKRNDKKSSSI